MNYRVLVFYQGELSTASKQWIAALPGLAPAANVFGAETMKWLSTYFSSQAKVYATMEEAHEAMLAFMQVYPFGVSFDYDRINPPRLCSGCAVELGQSDDQKCKRCRQPKESQWDLLEKDFLDE